MVDSINVDNSNFATNPSPTGFGHIPDNTIEILKKIFNPNWHLSIFQPDGSVSEEYKLWLVNLYNTYFDYFSISFTNTSKILNNIIETFNFRHSMPLKFEVAGEVKYENGQSAIALAYDENGEQIVPSVLHVMGTPKYKNGELIEFYGTTNNIETYKETDHFAYLHYWKKGNEVFSHKHFAPKKFKESALKTSLLTEKHKHGKIYSFKINYIPVQIFTANAKARPLTDMIKSTLRNLLYYKNEANTEWKYIRTIIVHNLSANPTLRANELKKKIEKEDTRTLETNDPDYNLANAISYLSSGSVTGEIVMNYIKMFKEDLYKHLFIIEQLIGGNNKHSPEALNANVNAYNWIWTRRNHFNLELAKFYHMVLDMHFTYDIVKKTKLPKYLKGGCELARPLEILLNLNADSQEKDNQTLTINKTGDK